MRPIHGLVSLGGMAALSWEVVWQLQASLAFGGPLALLSDKTQYRPESDWWRRARRPRTRSAGPARWNQRAIEVRWSSRSDKSPGVIGVGPRRALPCQGLHEGPEFGTKPGIMAS